MLGRRRRSSDPDGSRPGAGEPRLDPVRWGRPRGATLIRSAVVAVLLGTGAIMAWSDPSGCPPPRAAGSGAAQPHVTEATRAEPGKRGQAGAPPGAGQPGEAPPTSADAGPARPAVPRGAVGVPVRLAEPAALDLLRAGDRVDLLTVEASGGPVTAVAQNALVLKVTGLAESAGGGLLLALSPAEARRAVGAPERARFAVLVRPDG